MALFQFPEKSQGQPTVQQKPPQIETSVLTNLNLTQAEIDSHYKNQQVERVKKEVALEASAYYQEASNSQTFFDDPQPIKLGEIELKPKPKEISEISEVPDVLYAHFKEIEGTLAPENREHGKTYLDTFVQSFGQKAQENKDWRTTVKVFDLTTEGGIIQKPEVIKKLGEIYAADVETRRQIAELIQQRIDMKKQTPVTSAAAAPPAPSEKPATPTATPQMPMPENVIPTNRMAGSKTTLTQPVGTPSSQILQFPIQGETTISKVPNVPTTGLREAPPNPNPNLAPLAKAA